MSDDKPSVHAGFPSPAQDYMNSFIDLNKELVHHPAATFYARVVGDSMVDAGVEEGDVLVVSQLKAGATVSVFALDGKLVRQLKPQRSGTYRLNLSELPSGLYIVKADNTTYKITKP